MRWMGMLGSNGLGWRSFWLVADVIRGGPNPNITSGFSFHILGCYEFAGAWREGIDVFGRFAYRCEPIDVLYRNSKTYKIWVITPAHYFEEARNEFVSWVEEQDLITHEDDSSFAICLHEGLTEFQEVIAWWSLADGVLLTFREDVAQELVMGLNKDYAARQTKIQGN